MYSIITILTLCVYIISCAPKDTVLNNKYNSTITLLGIWIYISTKIFLVNNVSGDMIRYLSNFNAIRTYSLPQAIIINEKEPFFTGFTWIISKLTSNPYFFILSIWIIISLLMVIATKNMFKSYEVMVVLYSFFSYFLVYNFVTNIVRQGIAISFILLAVCLKTDKIKNNKLFLLALFLAPLFHLSALPFSIILLILKKISFKTNFLLSVWFISMLTYVTGFNSKIIKLFSFVPYVKEYTSSSIVSSYGSTNKLSFLIFSSFFIVFGTIACKYLVNHDNRYTMLVNTYIAFNTLFLLSGFVAYADRVASYSWLLIPLLVWYPIFNSQKLKRYRILIVTIVLSFFVIASILGESLLF